MLPALLANISDNITQDSKLNLLENLKVDLSNLYCFLCLIIAVPF